MQEAEYDVTDEVIKASNDRGEEIFASLVDELCEEAEEDGTDPVSVIYALWVSFIYVLREAGWTPEDLAKDLSHHANNSDVEGHG